MRGSSRDAKISSYKSACLVAERAELDQSEPVLGVVWLENMRVGLALE